MVVGAVIGAAIEAVDIINKGGDLTSFESLKQMGGGALLGMVGGGIGGTVAKTIVKQQLKGTIKAGVKMTKTQRVTAEVSADASGGIVGASGTELADQATNSEKDLSATDIAQAGLDGIVAGGGSSLVGKAFGAGAKAIGGLLGRTQKGRGLSPKSTTAGEIGGASAGLTEVAVGVCQKQGGCGAPTQ